MKGTVTKIELGGDAQEMMANFRDILGLGQAIAGAMDKENQLTVGAIQDKLKGPVLRVDTGRLWRSINRTDAVVIGGAVGSSSTMEVRSSVGSNVRHGGKSVEYAAIHEFGGRTKPRVIRPKRAKALKFSIGSRTIFAKKVNHPGSRMPERSYLRSTVNERLPRYSSRTSAAIVSYIENRTGNSENRT